MDRYKPIQIMSCPGPMALVGYSPADGVFMDPVAGLALCEVEGSDNRIILPFIIDSDGGIDIDDELVLIPVSQRRYDELQRGLADRILRDYARSKGIASHIFKAEV